MVDQFGYMSIHYECILGSNYAGPRYDKLAKLKFELQCRTIVMDAWANVSHVLAYKGEASIPEELRRDFHALSGLFYVADRHFQLFGDSRSKVAANAESLQNKGEIASVPVNVETLKAFIEARYPDRLRSDRSGISETVERLNRVGIETIGEVERALDRVDDIVIRYEAENPPRGILASNFNNIGIVNLGFAILNIEYDRLRHRPGAKYQDWLKSYREMLNNE